MFILINLFKFEICSNLIFVQIQSLFKFKICSNLKFVQIRNLFRSEFCSVFKFIVFKLFRFEFVRFWILFKFSRLLVDCMTAMFVHGPGPSASARSGASAPCRLKRCIGAGESYSPLIAGAIWRSTQSGGRLGWPVSEGRVFSFVFRVFSPLYWFFAPDLVFPIGFLMSF
jgi:hypothetical protein